MILFILFYFIKYKGKKRKGGNEFLLPPPPMGVEIPLPTPKLGGAYGVEFSFPS